MTQIKSNKDLLQELLTTIKQLKDNNKPKKFTLDGLLLGDLGEVAAAIRYNILLHETGNIHVTDGTTDNKKTVQIKTTQQGKPGATDASILGKINILSKKKDQFADYLIVLRLREGLFDVIYNGPHFKPKSSGGSISLNLLINKNKDVKDNERLSIKDPACDLFHNSDI